MLAELTKHSNNYHKNARKYRYVKQSWNLLKPHIVLSYREF